MQTKKIIFITIFICLTSQMLYGQYKEFMYGDSVRTYAVIEPSLDPNPDGYPLVIGLHGASSEGYAFIATTFLAQKAAKEKFIVACPNSLRYTLLTWWNAGGLYEDITGGTDDLGFISALIDTMIMNYNVDPMRVYVMGFSNGAAMAYRVAAELSPKIAAMGVSSGQMLYEYCNPEFPVPIIHFHGLSDDKFPYYGSSDSANAIPPVDSTMAIWRGINNCSAIPDTILNENGIVGKVWASSTGLSDIILYTYDEGEHDWPRPANWGISATDIIWDFLKIHNKSNETNLDAKQFMYDGEIRNYLIYEPFPNSGPRPLVVGLHCHTGTALGLLSYTDLIPKAKEENFIGVFPNSLFHPLVGTAWNAGSSFEELTRGTDDVGFISAVIDSMIKNYDIDTTRIYVTGHSNGSSMSYRFAAELSHRIAAMGGVAMPMVYENCDPEYPVPIIHFHGLSDTTCPYEGIVKPHITIPPVDSALAIWIDKNECTSIPDTILNENGIVGQKWASSGGEGDIVLYTIETCMHDWPTYDNYGISATDEIWDYLKLHTRIVTTNIDTDDNNSRPKNFKLYQNYPNPFNPSTIIKYKLPESSHIALKIYNIAGQEIATLVNEFQPAGEYETTWRPKGLPSGLYFYRLQAGDPSASSGQCFSETKKLILQK